MNGSKTAGGFRSKAIKLHYRALGSGPALVILHGLLGSLDNWVPCARMLAAHFHVFLPDLRNHGHSPHAETFSYDAMAEDVRGFLSDQRMEAAHLLGHSMGAKVAMRFAQLHPNLVQKLVVVDMSPRAYPARFDTLLDAMHNLDLGRFQRRDQVDHALSAVVPEKTVRLFLLKNLGRDGAGRLFWKPNLASIRANYGNVRGTLPKAMSVDRPTLFVCGGHSDYVQPHDLPLIHELFPRVTFKTIADAGHWVHADAPGRLTEVVTQFLLR
jgi:esterase